jgi:hypothetical protein
VSESDNVTITLSGGALNVTAMAMSQEICHGESTELVAIPGGGNYPNYTYEWKHNGIVVSTDSMFTVTPGQDESYVLRVFDGYNYSEDVVNVTVLQLPEFQINSGQAQILACPFDTITLQPSITSPGWEYYWSNGVVTPQMSVGTTGIGFDQKEYTLTVTTENGCKYSQEVSVIFDFSQCLGVEELLGENGISVYPNPTTGKLTIEFEDASGLQQVKIYDGQGRIAWVSHPGKGFEGAWQTSANLSSLARGIYLLEIGFSDKILHSRVVLE